MHTAMKRKHPSKKAPDRNDDFKPDSERVSRKSCRTAPPAKQVKSEESRETAKPVKRSPRVVKLAQDKEVARQKVATANLNSRFLQLPGG
jgi:hypothetical protein